MGSGGLVHGQLLQHVRQHERKVQSYRVLRKGRRVPGLAYQAIRQKMMMYSLELGNAGLTVCGSPYIMTLYEITFAVYIGLGHGEPFLMSLLWRSSSPRTCLKHEYGRASDAWFLDPVMPVASLRSIGRANELPERPLQSERTTVVPQVNRSLSPQ
jgi:hypothetical protein